MQNITHTIHKKMHITADYQATGQLRVAVYARFSTDGQKITSIDDQIRTCTEAAAKQGLTVSASLIFSDDAMTGAAHGTHRREHYHALREAIRGGLIDVIICDQQCRLARSAKESLTFFDELKAYGVRLLTADGFDSEQPTAQLLFGIKSVFSEFFLDETRHRVRRGMCGEFERGAMVTAVPYGYRVDVIRSETSGHCHWLVCPNEAAVVKQVFQQRKAGMSLNQITAILNGQGVPTPSKRRKEGTLYWRSSGVWRVLQNPIYKGLYVVNFGTEKVGESEQNQRLIEELALVSVADWNVCQSLGKRSPSSAESAIKKYYGQRGAYGGGKHFLAGVLQCGVCGVGLSCHHAKTDAGSIYCVQCEHATVTGVPGRQPQYVSVKGVRMMLHWLLQKIVSGKTLNRFRSRLREKLDGGREHELRTAEQELDKLERSQLRLVHLLQQINADDPILEQQYLRGREEVMRLKQQVGSLQNGLRLLNQTAIQQQLNVDLSVVLDEFLSDSNAPERTRSLLKRIFPAIVLRGKTDRYTAIFEITIKPGAILAEASGTAEFINSSETMWVRLNTSGSKNPVWSVVEIPVPESLIEQTNTVH
jgi:DNA invertase Pin-like site-specific DNA recombinase